ncbi:MAG: hypothetical protein M3680_25750, partial [Myxococcota bacterium]|nr:hypothetical protein [Myxococcota bacterium]
PTPAPRSTATAAPAGPQVRELDPGMVVDLLGAIARERRTGALLLRSGDLYKEAYFLDGHPVFVRCNVMEDRFGEFLVRRGALTRDQLERALAVLDHFGGRLGQALVSLGLVEPVEAVRLLAAQVAAKLVTACSWRTGTYEFREGEQNPWPALALELRTYPIIGRSIGTIPEDRLVTWATRVLHRPARLNLDGMRAFQLEPQIYDHLQILSRDGHTLGHVIDQIPTAAERVLVTAAAYVLWRGGVLRLALLA